MSILSTSVLGILREQHEMFREAIAGLSQEALNWRPGADTNSAAMLITHATESEGRILRIAIEGELRDPDELVATRLKSFDAVVDSPDGLVALIDSADAEAARVLAKLDDIDAGTPRTMRGSTGAAAWWVFRVIAHNGEHVGNLLLTRQLWEAQAASG